MYIYSSIRRIDKDEPLNKIVKLFKEIAVLYLNKRVLIGEVYLPLIKTEPSL